jgi:putative serine/threonine protein kinase
MQLKSLGVKAVEFTGAKMAFNLPVLGKGKVGIVLTAYVKTRRVALKVRRVDSDRKEMTHEAKMLRRANETQVGPRLIGVKKDFLLMEFLEGRPLPEWVANLKGRGAKNRIRAVLPDVLWQCRRLDEIGLDHGELSRAPKHVIIDSQDRAHIVDFEAASTERRPSNVTSICQYLFIGSQLARTVNRKLGQINTEALVSALQRYKFVRTEQNFSQILKVCNFKT